MSQAQLREAAPGRLLLMGELNFNSVVTLLPQGVEMFRQNQPLEMDLSGVDKANSAGLALLLEWLDIAKTRGAELSFTHLPESLLDIARISNAEDLLQAVQARS